MLLEDVYRLALALHVVSLAGVALHKFGVERDLLDKDAILLYLLLVARNLAVEVACLGLRSYDVAYGERRHIEGVDGNDRCQCNLKVVYHA